MRREGINATVRYAVVYPARAGWYAFSISFAGDESRGEAALRRLYNVMRTDGLWLLRKRSQTIGLVTAGGTHTPPTPPIPPVPPTPTSPDYLSFTARKAGATLRMLGSVNENNTYILPQLEYSDDGGETWNTLNFTDGEQTDSEYARVSDTLTFSEVGDTVLFRGNCPDGTVHWTVIDEDFIFYFSGGENTQQEDNVFSVGGNLQTLVDGTGESTTAPCFAELFRCDGILIDSAPDLPATTLSDYSYAAMFLGQTMLTTPANMGALTNASLPHVDLQAPAETYSMYGMYLDSALATMPSLPGIVIDENTSLQELYDVVLGIYMFVSGCPVVVTDDNGLTFNGLTGFDCSAETMAHLAQLIGADSELSTFFFANNIYGNVNGFAKSIINVKSDNGEIDVESLPGTYYGERYIWIKDGVSQQVTLTDHISNGYHFVKWMTRASENDQWVDDTQHLTDTFTFTAVPGSEYHYKAVDAEYVIHVDLDGISGYTGASYTDGNGDNQTAINVFPVNIPLQYCNLFLREVKSVV